MNAKWIKQGVFAALTMAAAASAQADWKLNGPLLQGISLNGPMLQGIHLNGPILQGISLNGPVLQGVQFNGPILQGPEFNGPVIQGVILNGPIFQGPTLNGPVFQGPGLNGPQLQGISPQGTIAASSNPYYGRGVGAFAVPRAQARHAVPGHSSLSGIAAANVQIKLAR